MLSSVIGLDLLAVYVINTYVSYCQKLDKKEKMRTVTSESSLEIPNHSANNWALPIGAKEKKRSWSQYLRLFYQYEIESRTADEALTKRWLKVANDSDDNNLLPYYRLSFMVQKRGALCKYSNRLHSSVHLRASIVFLRVLVYFTAVGRKLRLVILRKDAIFFGTCVEFWTDETYEAYDIDGLVKELTISLATRRRLLFSSPRRSLLAEWSCCRH